VFCFCSGSFAMVLLTASVLAIAFHFPSRFYWTRRIWLQNLSFFFRSLPQSGFLRRCNPPEVNRAFAGSSPAGRPDPVFGRGHLPRTAPIQEVSWTFFFWAPSPMSCPNLLSAWRSETLAFPSSDFDNDPFDTLLDISRRFGSPFSGNKPCRQIPNLPFSCFPAPPSPLYLAFHPPLGQ